MIDTKELRRLAQEAMHPVTKGRWMRLFGERTVYDRMEDGCRGIPVVSTPVSPPRPFEAACLDFIAAANPAAVIEILDRLEAAEKELAELRSSMKFRTSLIGRTEAERDALRAKITEMEQQEPVEWQCRSRPSWGGHQWSNWKSCSPGCAQDITKSPTLHYWQYEARTLYALPGAAAPEAKP